MDASDRSRLLRDAGLALGVAVVGVGAAFANSSAASVAVALVMSAPLALRRVCPRVALAALTVAAAVHVSVLEAPTVSGVAVPVLVHSLARWARTAVARAGLAVGLAGAVIGPARWLTSRPEESTAAGWATTVTAAAAVVVAAYVAGRRARDRDEREVQRAREAAERHRLELAERERALGAAAAEERTAVAREVHDIVAHSLSVIAVQAEGGRALTARHPERAPEVLGVIAEASRSALEDLRELVAMLRGDRDNRDDRVAGTAPPGYRPAPGLGDLDELVARLGDRARLRVVGDRRQVSPVVGLTVYRLVQESLTNALRHAGPAATVDVRVDIGECAVTVVVTDDGHSHGAAPGGAAPGGAARAGAGRGTGLAAMRERVLLHDGVLTAGPRAGGGFEVRAILPVHRPAGSPAGGQAG